MSNKCPNMGYYCYGSSEMNRTETMTMSNQFTRFDEMIKDMPTDLPLERRASTNFNDTLLYTYTSGTTGLPKPAKVKNYRYIQLATNCRYMTALKVRTRIESWK